MRIGCCTTPQNCKAVKEIGYDYVELSGCDIMDLDEIEFSDVIKMLKKLDLPCAGFNNYCRGNLHIAGPDYDLAAAKQYAKLICSRAGALGAHTVGIGAPLARALPDGYDMAKAMEQFEGFLLETANQAKEYGIIVLYEALNSKVCRLGINTKEGYDLVHKMNHPNLLMVLDFYHMLMMGEDYENIAQFMPLVEHLHISDCGTDGARDHLKPEGIPFYKASVNAARRTGYDKTISIEAFTGTIEKEGRDSYEIMSQILKEPF